MLSVNIQKKFAVNEICINCEIKPAFTALFGPSGAGKTTTLNMVAGLLNPDAGQIELSGRTLFCKTRKINLPPQRRNVGYIFQESCLFPHLTIRKNLEFGWKKVPKDAHKFEFDDIVAEVGIEHFLDRKPHSLSGGEKQRVTLARALMASPDYLLLDEPLAALDMSTKLSFLRFIKTVHERHQLPILYITHDLTDVINFADEVIVLNQGTVLDQGNPYALLDKMTAPSLLNYQGVANIIEVEIESHQPTDGEVRAKSNNLHLILPYFKCRSGEKLQLNVPASEIILSIYEPHGLSASNIIPGRVTTIHHVGSRALVDVDAGIPFTVEATSVTAKKFKLKKGDAVFLIIKACSFKQL